MGRKDHIIEIDHSADDWTEEEMDLYLDVMQDEFEDPDDWAPRGDDADESEYDDDESLDMFDDDDY